MKKRCAAIVTSVLVALGVGGTALVLGRLTDGTPQRAHASSGTVVPIELALLVDTSGSVDADEYLLQKDGYENAFRDEELGRLVEERGGIAVIYIEWSDADHQGVRIDWTRLDTANDCWNFANQIGAIGRQVEGSTMMAPALEFAAAQIAGNQYIGLRRVIDVSGDGRGQNYDHYLENSEYSSEHGTPWNDVIAGMQGVVDQVNGVCITTDSGVVDFYTEVLPQGEGSFMMQVSGFSQFGDAILTKLQREIENLPGSFD